VDSGRRCTPERSLGRSTEKSSRCRGAHVRCVPGWRDANDPKPLLAGEHDDVIKQGLPGVELPQATFDQCFPALKHPGPRRTSIPHS
jgi:hypothetical protein